jgi:hypothetical protein
VLGIGTNAAYAFDTSLDLDWQLSAQSITPQDSVFFANDDAGSSQRSSALLDSQFRIGDVEGGVAIHLKDLYNNSLANSSYYRETELNTIVRELFYQTNFDVGDMNLDVSAGKMRVDWGVGYGYRVLDLFRPYRRNPVGIQIEEGVGTLAMSHYGYSDEWTLIATDSTWVQQDTSDYDKANQQQGIGLRNYGLIDNTEYQWVAYFDNVREGLLGASVVSVFNDSLELHASGSYQRKYLQYGYSSTQPAKLQEKSDAAQFLIGTTWAHESGNSIIAEYWFDERAWSAQEWSMAYSSAKALPTAINENSIGASYAQAYQQANLVRHNMMFHWSLDSTAWSHWHWSKDSALLGSLTPTLDLLVSPEDGGLIATQWLRFDVYDSGTQSLEFELAGRFVAGKSGTVFSQLPDKQTILVNLRGRF